MKYTHDELKQMQALSLGDKVKLSHSVIREWYAMHAGKVAVSFSGGMDSTVMLHLVRSLYPDVQAITVKSLLYPEILRHVRNTENTQMVCPGMPFDMVIEKYGYPVISKKSARFIRQIRSAKGETATKRLRLTGIKSNGEFSHMGMLSKKWHFLVDAPFKISEQCCDVLKKRPLKKALNGVKCFVGTRCDESQQRQKIFEKYGMNNKDRSTPISFWLDGDIWEYTHAYNLPYSEIYDMGYKRTGCFACMFGVTYEKGVNRFQRMQKTHPKLWRVCQSWKIPEVLEYIGVNYDAPDQAPLFEFAASGELCEW